MKQKGQLNRPSIVDELIYIRAYHDFAFFVRYFFAHHCQYHFSAMHQDFCTAEIHPARRGRREAIAAPRGHAKTTFKTLFKVIHALVYGYEPFILILSHSASEAKDKVRTIAEELQQNPRLHRVYGHLLPSRAGRSQFITISGLRVLAKSKGQQVRGLKHGPHRPSLILCDDVESPEGVLSPEQRQKTRQWFFKDVLKCGQTDGSSNIMVIGTCLHPHSLLSELLQAPGWNSQKYQAVLQFAHASEHWEHLRLLYMDLSNPNRLQDSTAFVTQHQNELLTGTQVLWPEAESYWKLIRMKWEEGEASFASEKQNEPYDPERQIFPMHQAKRFRIVSNASSFHSIQWLDGSNKVVLRNQISRIIAFHDPALGQKPGQNREPDYAAIVVVALDQDGYCYCLDAWIEKHAPSLQVTQALKLHKRWGFDTLYLEVNQFQELLKETYREAMEQAGHSRLLIRGVHQYHNKMQRIATLEPLITNGHLLFAEKLNPRLIEQLTLFPTTYDDGPDALQGAIAQLKQFTTQQLFEHFYR